MNKHVAPATALPPTLGCTCFRLRRASRKVTQYYDRYLEPSGLKVTQYSLLGNIRASEQISITELAEALGMDRTTLTRNLKPLLDQGLVTVSEGADRRTRAIEVTPEGDAAFKRAVPRWKEAQAKLIETVGRDRVTELHRLIDEAVDRLG
ncbi:MarR family winged helix-turn-helix transcriptional regulator [Desertibaculum subflavum]|uniref:MarR family winged helix-turn-helix transcriptional regulator n=1 Tax=Desertibaculum subflavum TaxID=2268458 RepID=UPI000E660272